MQRRDLLKGCLVAGSAGMAGLLRPGTALAQEFDPFQATSVDAVLKALGVASAQTSDGIKITAPEVAEDGASVPVTIVSRIEHTTEIITIVSANPRPLVARNRFGRGADPSVSSRIKMGQTTDVIALVKAGDAHYMAKKKVKVTVGGCGG